jgi:hypothetical protein
VNAHPPNGERKMNRLRASANKSAAQLDLRH